MMCSPRCNNYFTILNYNFIIISENFLRKDFIIIIISHTPQHSPRLDIGLSGSTLLIYCTNSEMLIPAANLNKIKHMSIFIAQSKLFFQTITFFSTEYWWGEGPSNPRFFSFVTWFFCTAFGSIHFQYLF